MKKIGLLTGMLLLAVLTFAQSKQLSEYIVEPPKFIGTNDQQTEFTKENTPICSYLKTQLEEGRSFDEGVVVVLFTINADGTLSNFSIENSVSTTTDQAVVNCIRNTSGLWQPGSVNQEPVEMEKTIVVNFVSTDSPTPEQMAQEYLESGINKMNAAVNVMANVNLTQAVAERRANRKLNTALGFMEKADKYKPTEPSITFWQACVYEKIGNEMKRNEKLHEFMEMVNSNNLAQKESIDFVLR